MVAPQVVETIRAKVDIVSVIGRYVELTKTGKNYKGLCPFHAEKTPSFNVNPDGQFYHCFGCHAGGDVFEFLMQIEGIDFPEAVRRLGLEVGIQVASEPVSEEEQAKRREYRRIAEMHELAAEFFSQALFIPDAAAARAYLRERGISKPMIDLFRIGYSPTGWDTLYKVLTDQGYSLAECIASGLTIESTKGYGAYDRFRGRLMFPICDENGRPVAFGGRVLDDSHPKYLNSPETPIFKKGTHVYGLHLAKESIREQGNVIVVEGYMDVIALHQYGISNVVASLGTAFTEEQAKLLRKYCGEVITAFDGDAAGENATLRGLDLLGRLGFRVRVLTLPSGHDPDTFIRNKGADAFRSLLVSALPLIEFKLSRAFLAGDPRTVQGKMAIVEQVIPILLQTDSVLERTEYSRRVAEELSISPEVLAAEMSRFQEKTGKLRRSRNNKARERENIPESAPKPERSAVAEQDPRTMLERVVLKGVLADRRLLTYAQVELGQAGFKHPLHQKLWETLWKWSREGKLTAFTNRIEQVATGSLAAIIHDITTHAYEVPGQSYESCVLRLKQYLVSDMLRDVADAAGNLGAVDGGNPKARLGDLLVRYKELRDEIDRVCVN